MYPDSKAKKLKRPDKSYVFGESLNRRKGRLIFLAAGIHGQMERLATDLRLYLEQTDHPELHTEEKLTTEQRAVIVAVLGKLNVISAVAESINDKLYVGLNVYRDEK